MMASYSANDVTPQQWWNTITTQATAFFHLMENDDVSVVSITMKQLKAAQQHFTDVPTPTTMIRVRQHLLWSMRYLQMSLAEHLAQRPEKSRMYQQKAADDYRQACAILESCGVSRS